MAFINSFNVGTDLSLTILSNADNTVMPGKLITLDGKKTSFKEVDNSKVLTSEPIDNFGVPDSRVIPGTWSCTIGVDRSSNAFGQLYALLQQLFYQGGSQQYFTVTKTVRDPKGNGQTREQYLNCVFHNYDKGAWEKQSINKPTVQITAALAQTL